MTMLLVRAGLRELLSERPELRVVGEAANGVEAISYAKTLQPDVILMDVAMPQKNGIDATREIHDALLHIQMVALSTFRDKTTERAMREAGAEAYFSKTESTHRLFDYVLSLRPQAKGLRQLDPNARLVCRSLRLRIQRCGATAQPTRIRQYVAERVAGSNNSSPPSACLYLGFLILIQ